MLYIKLQAACLVILLYLAFVYFGECRQFKRKLSDSLFDEILISAIIALLFDAFTCYQVNHLLNTSVLARDIFHALFFITLEAWIYFVMFYIIDMCKTEQNRGLTRHSIVVFTPLILSALVVLISAKDIVYVRGKNGNYSMGTAPTTCYIVVFGCILVTLFCVLGSWRYLEKRNRVGIVTYLLTMLTFGIVQFIYPELTISGAGLTIVVLGIYMNMENPAFDQIMRYHQEMVMGFADLVESKDSSTGGHIKRTRKYVEMIANELSLKPEYRDVMTNDYIHNILNAAPMHDIGKVAIPDSILQKPGKLTDEEFETMKTHSAIGGEIIIRDFNNIGNEAYLKLAYEVARFHHEKWNGKGYPEGLSEKNIPLSARIMAVADVFDAVSAKRCYRDAMPIDKCFAIIEGGRGTDFDPDIVDAFLELREQVEIVCVEGRDE